MSRLTMGTIAALFVACGGSVAGPDAGDGSASSDAEAGVTEGGVVTPCRAPGNIMLCGGQCGQTCSTEKCLASPDSATPATQLGVCATTPVGPIGVLDCAHCPDGYVCALPSELSKRPLPNGFTLFWCTVPNVAKMYALNGRTDLSLYADRATYTDAPLPPPPETCPTFPGLRLCGGACGGCNSDEVCMGRSPLHPYSMCVKAKGDCYRTNQPSCLGAGPRNRCLTFKVDDAAQPTADRWSVCASEEQCLAAAQYYPGGAFCGP